MDKECPSQALARVCEDGLYEFADVLLKYGAKVMSCQWATMPLKGRMFRSSPRCVPQMLRDVDN